jgi:hypothetical protein
LKQDGPSFEKLIKHCCVDAIPRIYKIKVQYLKGSIQESVDDEMKRRPVSRCGTRCGWPMRRAKPRERPGSPLSSDNTKMGVEELSVVRFVNF